MRTSSPGPPGQANAAPWRRWLLPGIIVAFFVALFALLPLLLIGGLLVFSFRDIRLEAGGMGGLNSLTKAKARVIDAERPATRFTDVAGYANVKTDITEVVDYLRDPGRYHRAGRADRAAC